MIGSEVICSGKLSKYKVRIAKKESERKRVSRQEPGPGGADEAPRGFGHPARGLGHFTSLLFTSVSFLLFLPPFPLFEAQITRRIGGFSFL